MQAAGADSPMTPVQRLRESLTSPNSPVQRIRESLRGDTKLQLPARLGGSTIRLPHSLFAAVILAASLSMLLLAPSWMGASRVVRPRTFAQLPCVKCECRAREAAEAGAVKYGSQYFALCMSIKNQHGDLREWVAHHKFVGAGKIYIYDTGSEPPLKETILDHIDAGLVKYIWWGKANFGTKESRKYPQNVIYTDCMTRFGSKHQFIGFIDSDEFIVLRGQTQSVPALLQHMMAFEPIGALVVNWRFFGSSGHKLRPDKGVLQSYTRCLPLQNSHGIHVKSIVNTELYDRCDGPHHWLYKEGYHAVNEHFQYVDGPMTKTVSVDKIALHHYVLKSEEEYREKMERGSAMGNHKPFSFFKGVDALAKEDCLDGLKYGPYT